MGQHVIFFKKKYVHVCVLVWVFVYHMHARIQRSQKKGADSLELGLQITVRSLWMLRAEPGSLARAASNPSLLLWLAQWPTWEDRACFGWRFTGHPEEGTRGRNLFMGGTTHSLLGHPATIIHQENVPTCLLAGQSDGSTSQPKFPLLRENPPA